MEEEKNKLNGKNKTKTVDENLLFNTYYVLIKTMSDPLVGVSVAVDLT